MIPRYYQKGAVDGFFNFYKNGGTGNTLTGMPTGTGKSLVIALIVKEIMHRYPDQRILMLTHVKELIEQNYKTLLRVWPTAPAGVYSSGLGRKDSGFPITYAGIGSVAKKPHIFQNTDVIIVDEAHLIGPNNSTMYREFYEAIKKYKPYVIIHGLTATPFRLGQGMLTQGENALFDAFSYDITGINEFNRLISEGYLAPLIPLRTKVELDTEGLKMSGKEFSVSDMQKRYNLDEITLSALDEAIIQGQSRKHWLIFATGVEHCDRIAHLLTTNYQIEARAVHSKMKASERDRNIEDFRAGKVKVLVNNNVLTTGFDFNAIDLIIVLRPTMSPNLWVQMLGRGTRPAEGKKDCLVLDFAANTKRLGPVNDPAIPSPRRKKKGDVPRLAPIKICDNCGMYNHTTVRICGNCGAEFPKESKIRSEASQDELIRKSEIIIEVAKVDGVNYEVHQKTGKPDSLKVSYICGLRSFQQWICFEHDYPANNDAKTWWAKANKETNSEFPQSTAMANLRTGELKRPMYIRVRLDTKFPRVMDIDYSGNAFH